MGGKAVGEEGGGEKTNKRRMGEAGGDRIGQRLDEEATTCDAMARIKMEIREDAPRLVAYESPIGVHLETAFEKVGRVETRLKRATDRGTSDTERL